ncbi:MAG: hypothetical protein RI990_1713 [Planctomycetota bacterium]
MKTLATLTAAALVLTLAACDGGTPATKPVQKNTNPAAAGSIKSPSQELKERMSSTEGSAASAADSGTKK